MKSVVHIVGGGINGGAARGALNLHLGLLKQGIKSTILINDHSWDQENRIFGLKSSRLFRCESYVIRLINKIVRKVFFGKSNVLFSQTIIGHSLHNHPEVRNADIVNLHWVADGVISLYSVSKIKKPIYWFIRDMWPVTGGCHYSLNCQNHLLECRNCPVLQEGGIDVSNFLFLHKRNTVRCSEISAIGISNWSSEIAKSSGFFKDVITIPNIIDTDVFYPRKSFELSSKNYKILLGALNIKDFYKGFDDARNAILHFVKHSRLDVEVIVFGKSDPAISASFGGKVKVTQLGYINDDDFLAEIYSSADVYLMPSHMETFGKTIAEAMACGTPVVAYNVSGQKDIVIHKYTGYLAIPYDIGSLSQGLLWVEKHRSSDLRNFCSKRVEIKFSPQVICREYIKLVLDGV